MSADELGKAVQMLLESHPGISTSSSGHVAHVERYITKSGQPIGLELRVMSFKNIWVRADSVRRNQLADIDQQFYDHRTFDTSKPNHDLYGEHAFKDTDLICFKVKELWQAVRVISEVADLKANT